MVRAVEERGWFVVMGGDLSESAMSQPQWKPLAEATAEATVKV